MLPEIRRSVSSFEMISSGCCALLVFLSACAPPPRTGTTEKVNNWGRTKQCAERADKMIKAGGWNATNPADTLELFGYQNHYSPKYQRCYIELSIHQKNPTDAIPGQWVELYDAFESKNLATCVSEFATEQQKLMCSVDRPDSDSSRVSCSVCDAFINDHMQR